MRLSRTAMATVVAIGTLAAAGTQAAAHSPGMGKGMMGGGMGQGMMGGGMGQGMMMRRMMMMHGMMHGMMGPSMVYGMGPGAGKDLSVDDVKKYLGNVLRRTGNKRLKLGKVTQTDKDTIVAEIVTVDDSLVQKLSFDRHDRIVRQVN